MADRIVIDRAVIESMILTYKERVEKLEWLLEEMHTLRDLAKDNRPHPLDRLEKPGRVIHRGNGSSGAGRPRENPIYDKLKSFVLSQTGEFTNRDMKKAVHPKTRHELGVTVRALVKDGLIEVLEQPMGRRLGRYRRIGGESK